MKIISIVLIREAINLRYENIRMSTGEKVKTKDWNAKTKRLKKSRPDADQVNAFLNRLSDFCMTLSRQLDQTKKPLTRELLEYEYNLWKTGKVDDGIDFIQYWQTYFIDLPRLYKGRLVSNHTRDAFKVTLASIKAFMIDSRITRLTFNDITPHFYDKYMMWMLKVRNNELNTIGGRIKNIITVCKYAYQKGITENRAFQSFDRPEVQKKKIYLSVPELRQISETKLTVGLAIARDCFLVQAFISLRFDEFHRLLPENIEERYDGGEKYKVVSILPHKTADPVFMPIPPLVQDILNRYDGKPPKPFAQQTMNRYLKEVCKAAGINDDIQMTEYKGGVRKDVKLKKYEAVGTHTARRSFFTNAVISGVPVHLLMDMAGKKSEKEFWSYVCIEKELAAKTAKELPFFKTSFKDAVLKVV